MTPQFHKPESFAVPVVRPRIGTPWGLSDDGGREIAPGIVFYSTSSHGGFYVAPWRLAEMPVDIRDVAPWAGELGWYEEDCDWALVCLAFPQFFTPKQYDSALRTCKGYERARHLLTPERVGRGQL